MPAQTRIPCFGGMMDGVIVADVGPTLRVMDPRSRFYLYQKHTFATPEGREEYAYVFGAMPTIEQVLERIDRKPECDTPSPTQS